MKIKSYYQWEVYEIAKQLVLCEFNIMPRKMLYYHGQQNSYRTHRWMTNEDWVAVENAIENAFSKRTSEGRTFENMEDSKSQVIKLNHTLTLTLKKLTDVELPQCVAKEHGDKSFKLFVQCTIEHKEYKRDSMKDKCTLKDEDTENILPLDAKRSSQRIVENKLKNDLDENQNIATEPINKKSKSNKEKSESEKSSKSSIKHKSKSSVITPESKKLDKSLSAGKESSKKRRLYDCTQEKSALNKWLKPKDAKIEEKESKDNKEKSKPTSSLRTKNKAMEWLKSAEEIEKGILLEKKQLQNNQEVTDYLRGMMKAVPENYKFLSLMKLDKKKILASLASFKSNLDELYEANETSEAVQGVNGIDHYLVINLINNDVQLEMMNALSDAYKCENGSLIANVLLPEWVICLFMQHYELSRSAAMEQLKLQEEFQMHTKDKLMDIDLDATPVKRTRR